MTTPSLFIIRTCLTGDSYRKNFASFWSFDRLLKESRSSLETLAENIRNNIYDYPIDTSANETVLKRIHLCLSLSPSDFLAAGGINEESQLIIKRLETLEKQAIKNLSSETSVGSA